MTQSNASDLRALFNAQYAASRRDIDVPLSVRRDRLLRMQALIDNNGPALAQAVQADFGVRSAQLTEVADLLGKRNFRQSKQLQW